MRRRIRGVWLGRQRYAPVHELMQKLNEARQFDRIGDTVLFVEHEPVITLGRGAHHENLLVSEQALQAAGVDLVSTGRGGDVTLHAPGQLVAYPILSLVPDRCDVRRYVADLTEVMRLLALTWGVAGGPVPELIGLWVDAESAATWSRFERAERLAKLGAIGVRITRWVTMHGFAFNLSVDLRLYDFIVPCGISAHGVTSIAALVNHSPSVRRAAERALALFGDVFDADVVGLDEHTGVESISLERV